MENRRLKILAIDDNQDNLITIKALIQESFPDSSVFLATSGPKGLSIAETEDPDLILLDIVMPDMDGFEVCQILKSKHELKDIPVVFVTAIKGDKDSRIKALEYGAEAFLAKPIDESELTAQIRAMVKIKNAHIEKRDEKQRLATLVEEKTKELTATHYGTLMLLKDLRKENEARKKSEQALIIAKERAEESDKLKSAFLANMSHEIRTPMNGILGFAELLKEPELTGEQQQNYIRIIEKSGIRMLNIINDLIDISKIEAGLMNVSINNSKINEQIEFIYNFFKPEVEGKGMTLSYSNFLSDKDSIIETDGEKVYTILTNLVKNAIKYSDKGSIDFGYIFIPKTNNNGIDNLEFYVRDTGIGIPKNRQVAIFERFIQADISDKMARQGAGLGLSITKAYVEMLGGRIWVESEPGKGSVFYFTLPYKIPVHSTQKEEFIISPDNIINNLKILIAEDDEPSELLIQLEVEKYSKEILKAHSGIEAIELCRNHPDIDLILMDIQMPIINGFDATKKIREFNKKVVIIAQTAFGLTGDKEKALEAGCSGYMSKPINGIILKGIIEEKFKN